jgi:hypothetical protein
MAFHGRSFFGAVAARNAPACFQPTSAEQVMSPILWMPAGDPVALSTTVAVSFKRSLGTPVPP